MVSAEKTFLKMRNAADMLAVHFLSQTGQLSGDFFQEEAPPWDVWWQILDRETSVEKIGGLVLRDSQNAQEAWTSGQPGNKLKKAVWPDLFKKFILVPDPEKGFSDVILIKTGDKSLFFEIVRRHFLLQQGLIDFATFSRPENFWLISIRHPSIWAIELLPSRDGGVPANRPDGDVLAGLPKEKPFELYNQVNGCEGLFVQSGWNLSSPENGLRLNRFKFTEKKVILVKSGGEILSYSPFWNHGNSIVEVSVTPPQAIQTEEKEKMVIVPVLRETEETHPHDLWRVDEPDRFKAVLSNESMKRFSGFSAWFGKDGKMWVIAQSDQSDRGLATLFSDAFAPYVKLEKQVISQDSPVPQRAHGSGSPGGIFIPAGKVLSPRLSEERLKQIYGCQRDDSVCLDMIENRLQATVLAFSQLKKIDFFITFQAENAVSRIENYQSQWTFEFPEVKKKG